MANTASVNVAGATVTGNYDANGILNLTITFSNGFVFVAGGGLSRSELEDAAKNSGNPALLQEAFSIWSNYGDITNAISQQLSAETVSVSAAQDPGQPSTTTQEVQNSVPATPELVPSGGGSIPYDELGNLNPGWEVDELGNPYYVGTDMVPKTEPAPASSSTYIDYRGIYPDAQSDPYDETGALNPGWSVDETNQPYWVGFPEAQKTIPNDSIQGTPYDDEGNLMPGWNVDELGTPYYVGNGFVAPATQQLADEGRANAEAAQNAKARGLQKEAQSQATKQDSASFQKAKDWRVRLSLAPGAKYLYKGVSKTEAGILAPLQDTDGVIFPYTPNISVAYAAGYDATDIAHSNYKVYQYKGSSVDNVTITGDFTAQDTTEANYMLAVIHFFRSVTKMFYGQDQNPKNGVPPPLVYLSGFGTYQFDNHPLAITNFTYTTPTDVDYIRAGSQTNMPGQNVSGQTGVLNTLASAASAVRLLTSNLTARAPNFRTQNSAINSDATYVPTKLSISITAVPVVSRNDISNRFSLKEYASGKLLQGSKNNGGGIW